MVALDLPEPLVSVMAESFVGLNLICGESCLKHTQGLQYHYRQSQCAMNSFPYLTDFATS